MATRRDPLALLVFRNFEWANSTIIAATFWLFLLKILLFLSLISIHAHNNGFEFSYVQTSFGVLAFEHVDRGMLKIIIVVVFTF